MNPSPQASVPTPAALPANIANTLRRLDHRSEDYAVDFVATLLEAAIQVRASDIHFQPADQRLEIRWRINGVLEPVGCFPPGDQANPVTRLKVLAELLTYRRDTPQEGRIRNEDLGVEMRVSTFPTLHGERAVVRLFQQTDHPWYVPDLKLPTAVMNTWQQLLGETSGAIVVCGPAGSGKTTTAYASLRQIICDTKGGRSIVTIEDPVESEIAGVAQSQVNPVAGFTLSSGLKSLLRQDPEVIFVGEIRDPDTAAIAFQASLTGHLTISTFHANSPGSAVARLRNMGLEPHVLKSGIQAVLHQRLVRRLCDHCKTQIANERELAGWDVHQAWQSVGCESCLGTGFRGRIVLAELALPKAHGITDSLTDSSDEIQQTAIAAGLTSCFDRASQAITDGLTSPLEARRALGSPFARTPHS